MANMKLMHLALYFCVIIILCMNAKAQAASCKTYTVKSGDTCYAISQAKGISLTNFLSWNAGIVCNNLQIGQVVCISAPSASGSGNGKIFREYIGAYYNGVKLSSVPIVSSAVEVHLILSFAIDYKSDGSAPTNGVFSAFWDTDAITPAAVQAVKSQHSNVKVMLSLGGDTVSSNPVQFQPTSVSSWVSNAVTSLTALIQQYHLDGIDIDYEHFDHASSADFASAVGQLVTKLKSSGVISTASIAPYDDVQAQYSALWSKYASVIDYVNFQFYTYGSSTTASKFVSYFKAAASTYSGGKILASFTTETDFDTVAPSTAISACKTLKSSNILAGIFIWCADTSYASSANFQYEKQAQNLLV